MHEKQKRNVGKGSTITGDRKFRAALRPAGIRNGDPQSLKEKTARGKSKAAHSYLKASTGFIFAALFAGYAPAATPTIRATPKPTSRI